MRLNETIVKYMSFFIFDSNKRKKFRNKFFQTTTIAEPNIITELQEQIQRDKLYSNQYNMGVGSYAGIEFYVANPQKTKIGKFCSIGANVCLGVTQHPLDCLTTHGFICNKNNPRFEGLLDLDEDKVINWTEDQEKPPITIGNDVWIGYRSIIMDGIKIGDGAVVGANSVVTKDVEPYTIVAGAPAKAIRKRFSGGGDYKVA